MIISKGEKVQLRYPKESDARIIHRWENDPTIMQFGDNKEPYSLSDIGKFIKEGQRLFRDGQERIMICSNEDEKAIGCIDLYDFHEEDQSAGVGILIYEEKDRDKGFGSESLTMLITYVRDKLKLDELFCRIGASNKKSLSLFISRGFTIAEEYRLPDSNEVEIYLELTFE